MESSKSFNELTAAAFHTEAFKQFSHDAREEVADIIADMNIHTLLDLDCGTGLLLDQVLSKRPDIDASGFDYSIVRVKQARERLNDKNVDLRFGQAIQLPYPDNSFDAVVSTTTFHHYKQPAKVLREVHRVLKPDGEFIICDTYLSSTLRYLNSVAKPLNKVADMQIYSKKDIWRLLNATGFTGIQWRLMNKFAYLVKAKASDMPLIHEF